MITSPSVISELHRIADSSGGVLRAEDVVAAARNEVSPLHSWFQWDDSRAAELYRIQQARELIRVTVRYTGGKDVPPVRVFVSLKADQQREGGYRSLDAVLSDDIMRLQLLEDAREDMRAFQVKYRGVKELVSVFEAMMESEQKIIAHAEEVAAFA